MKPRPNQDGRYTEAAAAYGAALARLAAAFEANPERRRDLLQDMHVALWRSMGSFDGRCALRTWVYRVAHNVAASHVDRERRARAPLVTLDQIEQMADDGDIAAAVEERDALARLNALIRRLAAPDRQVMALYLEGLDGAAIADITGLTPGAVATRVSRLKTHLAKSFQHKQPDASNA